MILTAHFTPTMKDPPKTSPFLRTARIASAGFVYPILKQFDISRLGSGSVDCPKDRKKSEVKLNLSGGYPKTMT